MTFTIAILIQAMPFLLLAFAINISLNLLRATDMTIDGSFVLGAAIFARLVTYPYSPFLAASLAIFCGALAGMMTGFIQQKGRIDSLLAGILATFILSSINLIVMGKPNINLISTKTLLSNAFSISDIHGLIILTIYIAIIALIVSLMLSSRFGLTLRAFGDNPVLLKRLGKDTELYRLLGFGLTNLLAAASGVFSAQTIGYADISMGFGMTLTGIGAIILGRQLFLFCFKTKVFRISLEFMSCLLGVVFYFLFLNLLLRIGVDPIYLKMLLGILLIFFLRTATLQLKRVAT